MLYKNSKELYRTYIIAHFIHGKTLGHLRVILLRFTFLNHKAWTFLIYDLGCSKIHKVTIANVWFMFTSAAIYMRIAYTTKYILEIDTI